jgi:hypothetical protein
VNFTARRAQPRIQKKIAKELNNLFARAHQDGAASDAEQTGKPERVARLNEKLAVLSRSAPMPMDNNR